MRKLKDICIVDWGDTSLTKSAYVENGKYLGVSAAGCDGRMDYYNFDAFTPVISAIGANCGKMFLPDEPFVAIKNTITLKPKEELSGKYLYYALFNNRIPKRGGGQPFISKGDTEKYEIPLPDNKKQRFIVETLDRTLEIINNRQKELKSFDSLIKARFVEMFDGKGYPMYKWIDVFNTTTGKLDSNAMVEDGEYPFFTCAKETFRIDKYAFDQEALLLAGNNAAGKYDKGKFNAYQRTYVLGLKQNWSYRLFQYQLEDKLAYLQQQSLGGLTKYLTLKILGELDFIVPPIQEQNEFEKFVDQVDKSKAVVQKALDKTQLLFDSLMQEYFG